MGIKRSSQTSQDQGIAKGGVPRAALLEALPDIRRFARNLAGNADDGDDLLQTTVERVLDRGVPQDVNVLKWMYRVCRNLWIDEVRSRQVRLKATEQPELQEGEAPSTETVAASDLALRDVRDAVAQLPEEQSAVLMLVAVEGMSYRDAAEVLEVPIGTVMSRLARARSALAGMMQRQGERNG